MSDISVDRVVEAIGSPENKDLARSLANDVGNLFSDGIRNLACSMPTTGLAIMGSLAIVARMRHEVELFAIKSLVERGDPESDKAVVSAAVAKLFEDLCAEPMTDMGPGPYPESDGTFVIVLPL